MSSECVLQAVEQEGGETPGNFADNPWSPWIRNVSESWSGEFQLSESNSEWKPLLRLRTLYALFWTQPEPGFSYMKHVKRVAIREKLQDFLLKLFIFC